MAAAELQTITNSEEWESLVSDDTIVYGTWEWGTVCERFGHKRRYLGIENNGELIAGLPCMIAGSRVFGRELVSMPYAPYGAMHIDSDDQGKRLLDELVHLSDQLGIQACIRGVNIEDERVKNVNQFVTFEVGLNQAEGEIWEEMVSSRFRRGVRKSRKKDVRVETGFNEQKFSEFYQMYLDNMQYHGTPPYSKAFFRDVYELLDNRNAVELYIAYNEAGKPINGVTAFFHGRRGIYWNGVSDHEYRDLNGGSRLLWEAIVDSCERGLEVFDLGRTREDTGVYNYKKSIGTPVDLTDSYYAPEGDVSLTKPEAEKYEKYKRIWRKLPTKVTEYVGPHVRKRLTM